jgi:hypothetical protein
MTVNNRGKKRCYIRGSILLKGMRQQNMKKVYMIMISLILMGNSTYAALNDSKSTEDKEQYLSIRIERTIESIVQSIVSQSKQLRIATQEGEKVIVYSYMDAMVSLERVGNEELYNSSVRVDQGDSFNADIIIKDSQVYLELNDVKKIISARAYKNETTNKIILAGYGVRAEIDIENHFAYLNENQVEMSAAPIIIEGEYYLPVKWVAEIFAREMVYSHQNNQPTVLIRPKTILQDITGDEKILFFRWPKTIGEQRSKEPFLIFEKQSEIKAFAKLMNNAVEMVGIPEWSGFDYMVEVYDKEEVINISLCLDERDSSRYGGTAIRSEGSKHGYVLQKDDMKAFLKVYGDYLER